MTPSRHARCRLLALLPALLAFTLVPTVSLLSANPAGAAGPPSTQAPQSYVLVDADSGAILMASNEHQPHLTASTIKPLTALVTLEHLPLNSFIHVSRLAASQPAAKIDMLEGSAWPLQQAIDSLMIVSANDAAYALAENTGGDLAGFEKMAMATGARLGLRDTSFHDPAGLDGPQGFGGGTTSSAYDLAIVARNALSVPAIAEPATRITEEFTDPSGVGRRLVNHNRGFLNGYPGAIGLKTGFTKAASRTLITAARREGHTMIAVVMGTWDDTGWASYLLDQGFAGITPAGGSATLPPVRVATVDGRAATFAALPRAFGGGPVATRVTDPKVVAPKTPKASTPPASKAGTAKLEPTATRAAAGAAALTAAPIQATTPSPNPTPAESGFFSSVPGTVGIVVFGLLVVLVLLRRRAVKRQRTRRIERVRAHAEARRRGMIDVVTKDDGEVRAVPAKTSHHVAAAGKRHLPDRRVVRAARPRDRNAVPRDRPR